MKLLRPFFFALAVLVSITANAGIFRTQQAFHDFHGNTLNNKDAVGTVVSKQCFYDNANRLTNTVYSSGSWAQLSYDLNSNVRTARCVNVEASSAVTNNAYFTYDNMNRLASAVTKISNLSTSWSLGYGYDHNGNTTNIVYPNGKNLQYVYDQENRLTSVKDWNNKTTSFTYDNAGKLTRISYPNSVTTSYGYDADERLTSYSHGGFISHVIFRNANGFKTQENINAGLSPCPTNACNAQNSFNNADQLTQSINKTGATVNNFDLNGNLTSNVAPQSTTGYIWDGGNRLVTATTATNSISYLYDPMGNRIGRISGTTTNYFVINYNAGLKNVLAEVNPSGTVTRYYIWGPNGLIAHIDSDGLTTHYYHADEQGSTLALTDSTGTPTDQFAYTPYGGLTARTGTTSTPYQWLGGVAVRCENTDFYAMQRRFYSSIQKRFLSADPSGIDGGVNLYAYANANPGMFTDPYGLCAEGAISSAANFAYNGGIIASSLRSLAGSLDSYSGDSVVMGGAAGGLSYLANTAAGIVSPRTYVDGLNSFGYNIGTVCNQAGWIPATSYALTSWNVGAIYSGVANIDLVSGAPVGDWCTRGSVIIETRIIG